MIRIRNYDDADASRINDVASRAFDQFKDAYDDWPGFRERIASMSALAWSGEIIVAQQDGLIVGAVAYIGPGKPKANYFCADWPIMRMLVVLPEARGHGVGRALAMECFNRAKRDGAPIFALHTSELMKAALSMYLRMGFKRHCAIPAIHGVNYNVYLKDLDT